MTDKLDYPDTPVVLDAISRILAGEKGTLFTFVPSPEAIAEVEALERSVYRPAAAFIRPLRG